MTTMKQRAAARRNIRKAIAANRRHGGRKKGHRSRRSSRGKSTSSSKGPGIGAAYTAGKATTQVLAPVIDLATHVGGQTPQGALADLKFHAVSKEYALGLASTVAQAFGDRKIQHAQALSRGSITAWAAEAYPIAKAVENRSSARAAFSAYNGAANGYSPVEQSFKVPVVYGGLKYGLGVARKAANRTTLLRPIKKGLSMVGLTA